MSPAPDRPEQELPYPSAIDRRVSRLEAWRAGTDEWRRSVDAWRETMEREGVAVALARLDGRLRGVESRLDDLHEDVQPLVQSNQRSKGVALTGRALAIAIGALASFGTIIGLLIAVLNQAPG